MNTTQKYWYQDGGNVFAIVFVVIPITAFFGLAFYSKWQEDSKPQVVPMATGQLQQSLIGNPTFVVTLWHQHPGNLRNGALSVKVDSEMARGTGGSDFQIHSFELWEPNKDHAVSLAFPLKSFDSNIEMPITFQLTGKDIKPFIFKDVWLGNSWKSNQKLSPGQ
ncbi:hypothetical protein [Planctomicrobium piriforme]|uniref:Uncharacterized protein n=1 Tax=Planctomicrobium piriforme TaxID=1576369 RepID=A0A1I3RYK5_9PLAN|nr:hypothetical protein [Planctomicrobium piriforme]SFJ51673.1 hypothetical protein SAMN05421753_12253 [Planctomicrobium piriforme]